ncbi:MAG TPA: protease complex subunit PrcB family protein [Candidatus Paceibacterota bacterium]|jgi:hypothetical protein
MRDALVIFVGIILAMAIGSYLFFNGAPSLPTPSPNTAPKAGFSTLQKGQNAGTLDRRANFRINSEEELAELWGLIYGTGGPAIPAVDFGNDEVIAVFDGSHATGGYDVEVADISDADGRRTIIIRRYVPGDTCAVGTEITSPFHLVRAPKSTLPISREEETITRTCP